MSELTIIELIKSIIGDVPYGLDFIYVLLSVLLLLFMFVLVDKLFEILFSRFMK